VYLLRIHGAVIQSSKTLSAFSGLGDAAEMRVSQTSGGRHVSEAPCRRAIARLTRVRVRAESPRIVALAQAANLKNQKSEK
jgi:hypothetical protein